MWQSERKASRKVMKASEPSGEDSDMIQQNSLAVSHWTVDEQALAAVSWDPYVALARLQGHIFGQTFSLDVSVKVIFRWN